MVDRFVLWLGATALMVGVAAATFAGAGIAAAQDDSSSAGGAGSTASDAGDASQDSTAGTPGADRQVADPPAKTKADTPTKPDSATGDADDAREPGRFSAPRRTTPGRGEDGLSARTRDDGHPAEMTRNQLQDSRVEVSISKSAIGSEPLADEPEVAPTQSEQREVQPVLAEPEPAKPDDVVESNTATLTSVVSALVHPLASPNTPAAPAVAPQMWTLMAASRREFETQATTMTTVALQPAGMLNSLTYTPDLALQDRFAMVVHETFRMITNLTGVDVYATLGSLISSRNPPFFLTFGLDARRTTYLTPSNATWEVWEFRPPNPTGKTVVALHGGGWVLEPNVLHWIDYTMMARQTGATVIVPLYTLATTEGGRATVVVPDAAEFISDQIEANGAENVSLYGDSAGSSIAISAVRQLLLQGKPVPSSMVLISLTADHSLENPDVRTVDDPLFDLDRLAVWDSHWYDGLTDRRDPLLSPLFFETEILRALPPTTIYVGEREILYPDTLLLYSRGVEVGAPISVVVGTGLIHDWPMSGLPLYTQTAAVRSDILRQLGL